MKTYRVSEEDHNTMSEKIRAAQTLLNVHCIAAVDGGRPPSATRRLDLAEEAEELVNDVANILYRMKAQHV